MISSSFDLYYGWVKNSSILRLRRSPQVISLTRRVFTKHFKIGAEKLCQLKNVSTCLRRKRIVDLRRFDTLHYITFLDIIRLSSSSNPHRIQITQFCCHSSTCVSSIRRNQNQKVECSTRAVWYVYCTSVGKKTRPESNFSCASTNSFPITLEEQAIQ